MAVALPFREWAFNDLVLGDLAFSDLTLGGLTLGDLTLGDLTLGDLALSDLACSQLSEMNPLDADNRLNATVRVTSESPWQFDRCASATAAPHPSSHIGLT